MLSLFHPVGVVPLLLWAWILPVLPPLVLPLYTRSLSHTCKGGLHHRWFSLPTMCRPSRPAGSLSSCQLPRLSWGGPAGLFLLSPTHPTPWSQGLQVLPLFTWRGEAALLQPERATQGIGAHSSRHGDPSWRSSPIPGGRSVFAVGPHCEQELCMLLAPQRGWDGRWPKVRGEWPVCSLWASLPQPTPVGASKQWFRLGSWGHHRWAEPKHKVS